MSPHPATHSFANLTASDALRSSLRSQSSDSTYFRALGRHADTPLNLVGPEVRRRRIEAGFSQEALAARIQVKGWDLSRGGLSKIESRLRRVNDAELYVLGRVLGCEIVDLYPRRVKGIAEVLRQGRGA